ncbi:glycine-rich domain-containing protein-like [Scytonema sp. UIC 10036]|uniref:glycine-rich domain-containing protein n=1 Tax=Scytonema sp. UIC 10036 TaxID=2304196 RepID=UPI0012DACA50|nr:glycine-rich domain-containing protein-like [Scytonema sp. UIC 10036]MUG92088.1 glycine-rich domain-containing protein-like [Scytonema sp. UIC 10036]
MSFNVTSATSVKNKTFQENLESLNLEPIAQRLMYPEDGRGWSRKQIERAIARYKMFLHLIYLYPNSALVPTYEIDIVWHHHILDTRKYACDCEQLFGYFVHHNPNLNSRSETNQLSLAKAFYDTKTLFAEHFGVLLIEKIQTSQSIILCKDRLQQASACADL